MPLVGIFIGGASARMAGQPKGLLPAPGSTQTLVERLCSVVEQALPGTALVLVGQQAAYDHLPLRQLPDAMPGRGPLAGLTALCEEASSLRLAEVIALACDLPFVGVSLVRRLALHAPEAAAVAPRLDERWQPLCARYRADTALEAARAGLTTNRLSLQSLLDRLAAEPLPLEPEDAFALRDWDTPEDRLG